jgi:hypothetical protein
MHSQSILLDRVPSTEAVDFRNYFRLESDVFAPELASIAKAEVVCAG